MTEPRRSRTWLWYFLILVALTALSLTILIRYNLGKQLKPEQLEQARALWREKGSLDYDLEYTKTLETETGTETERYASQIRGGQVVSAERNGQPLEKRQYIYQDMPALFMDVEGFLQEAAKPGSPRTYLVATFDATDGHLTHLVRRVMGTARRLQVNVTLTPVAPEQKAGCG